VFDISNEGGANDMDINLRPPENCGVCNVKTQLFNTYFCNYPVDKAHEMLNFSAYRIDDLEIRPDWCPLSKIIEKANNMSDENKRLFNQMCDGMRAMFELINNNREANNDNN